MNLQKHKNSFVSLVLLAALFTSIQTPAAQAATAGTGNCVQTVDTSAGVSVYQDLGFCYVAFKNATSYTWSPAATVRVIDLLVVAGGGGGGSRHAGGGGAGGVINVNSVEINGTVINLAIGAGGAGGANTGSGGNSGINGSNSQVSGGGLTTRIAIGGGGGGHGGETNSGGSGSGGGNEAQGGAATAGQGNPGSAGDTSNPAYWVGGGGGGAGETGKTSAATKAGSGGSGAAITWLTANAAGGTGVGVLDSNQYFVGGGGGGGSDRNGIAGGNAGLGGGGAGSAGTATPGPGVVNTGGGGGGAGVSGSGSVTGGAGGRGVILIRYLIDQTAPTFTNSTSFSFAENTAISTNAATITVNESSTITITSGTDSALFTLVTSDSVTARIRFLSSPNFESRADVGADNVYNISVRASDTNGNIANQSISITVTNVNEAPTITTASSAATHSITQAENISSVVTYAATDVDAGSSLSFSISGTDAADFAINSSSGVLTFAANPDFEAPADSDTNNSYVLVITVSDGVLSDIQTLTVTITNANETSSVGAPTLSGAASKGSIVTISVTTTVAGKVRFSVGGKRISNCLARTTTGSYPNFSATCSWRPSVTGSQNLTARVTPTDNTFSAATSAGTAVWVTKRTNAR